MKTTRVIEARCIFLLVLFLLSVGTLCASDPPGTITTVTGGGTTLGDGGPATNAALSNPTDAVADASGNLFIADYGNSRIRKVDAVTGLITTIAGNGVAAFGGDGGIATSARLQYPNGVAITPTGDIYIADTNNHRVRKVDATTGIISTVVGTGTRTSSIDGPGGNPADDLGDGGPAVAATLYYPFRVRFDSAGNLFIADTYNHRIRKVDTSTGTISTVGGDGSPGCAGDGGPATNASVDEPIGIAFDTRGNLFIASWGCHQVRKVDAVTGIISTAAGMGPTNYGFAGDGGPATSARLFGPEGVGSDAGDNLFIADEYNGRIRKVNAATGIITTVAGGGSILGDGGPATNALVSNPGAVTADAAGSLFIADQSNNRIRRVVGVAVPQDSEAPQITCAAPDGLWHASDVLISCTASDTGSGLASPADAAFSLVTSVSTGTETSSASTTGHQVCDVAGNCATAGPIAGNMVDKKAPVISITAPANAAYLLNQAAAASYSCSDGGSGVLSCTGPVASGANFDTASVGSKTFTVNASDNVSNSSSSSVTYSVAYSAVGLCLGEAGHQILQPINADGSSVFKRGSTVPAKFRVCDANGYSMGTAGVVSSFTLVQIISGTYTNNVNEQVDSTTPDSAFRWDSGAQQWIFNISTKSLSASKTYAYLITLNDGSRISFQFGLK